MTDIDPVRTLHVGDVHLADSPPGWRTENYTDEILAKLMQVVSIAEDYKVDAILLVGDLFHHRRRVSHRLIARLHDVLSKTAVPKVLLPGNHDLRDNLLSTVDEQPIGLLSRMPGFHLALEPFVVLPGRKVATIVKGRSPESVLSVLPVPYRNGVTAEDLMDCAEAHLWRDSKFLKRLKGNKLVWAHLGVVPDPSVFPYPTIGTEDIDGLEEFDALFCGHIHDDLGTWRQGSTYCANLGSISRGSLTEDNRNRRPRVLYSEWFEAGRGVHLPIALDVKPASEVFRLEERDSKALAGRVSEAFTSALAQTRLSGAPTRESVVEALRTADVPQSVAERAVAAIEEVW